MAQEQTAREDVGVSAEDVAALKRRADTAEAQRDAATAAAQQLQQERDQAVGRHAEQLGARVHADKNAAVQAIAAATAEGDSAEREYAEAVAANDAGAMAKAQRKMTDATITLREATQRSAQIDNWVSRESRRAAEAEETRKANAANPRPAQTQQTQTEEIDISGYTGPTQTWLKQHPHLLKNTQEASRLRNKVIAAHYDAEAEGLVADTPSYFDFLEKRAPPAPGQETTNNSPYSQAADTVEIDLEKPVEHQRASDVRVVDRSASDRPVTPQSRQTSSALPPSRTQSPANGSSQQRGRVTLTLGEQEAARISNPNVPVDEAYRQYAESKLALQAEGRL